MSHERDIVSVVEMPRSVFVKHRLDVGLCKELKSYRHVISQMQHYRILRSLADLHPCARIYDI
jgi:hypothetical protein